MSLLDMLERKKVEVPKRKGKVHVGAYSRERKEYTNTNTDKPCCDCKVGFKYIQPNGRISPYCMDCRNKRNRVYCTVWYRKTRDAAIAAGLVKELAVQRTGICPRCKVNMRGYAKSGKSRGYCKPCDRIKAKEKVAKMVQDREQG